MVNDWQRAELVAFHLTQLLMSMVDYMVARMSFHAESSTYTASPGSMAMLMELAWSLAGASLPGESVWAHIQAMRETIFNMTTRQKSLSSKLRINGSYDLSLDVAVPSRFNKSLFGQGSRLRENQ